MIRCTHCGREHVMEEIDPSCPFCGHPNIYKYKQEGAREMAKLILESMSNVNAPQAIDHWIDIWKENV